MRKWGVVTAGDMHVMPQMEFAVGSGKKEARER